MAAPAMIGDSISGRPTLTIFTWLDQRSPYLALCSHHRLPHGALDGSQFSLRTVLRLRGKMPVRRIDHNWNRWLLLATISVLIMGTIVSISLLNFVAQIPISALKNDDQTDAIVVLTGGSSRLEEGVNLLMQRKAKKLLSLAYIGRGCSAPAVSVS